jgi:glycosyltransferase 2 family protein
MRLYSKDMQIVSLQPSGSSSALVSPDESRQRARKWGFLRLALSLGFLVWVAHRVDFVELNSTFSSTSMPLLATALLTHGLGLLICGLRWRILLRIQEILIPLRDVLYLYWVGSFFNMFLPSSVGGDLLRIHLVGRWSGRHLRVISSVLADRASGVLALGAIGGLAACWIATVHWSWARTYIVWLVILLSLPSLGLWWVAAKRKKLRTWLKGLLPARLYAPLAGVMANARLYTHNSSRLIAVMGLSLLLQTHVIIEYFLVARAVGIYVSLLYFFALVPAVVVASLLPISVSGIGLREGILVSALVPLGASPAAALAVGIWVYLLGVLASLGGGVIYWWRGLSLLSVEGPASCKEC